MEWWRMEAGAQRAAGQKQTETAGEVVGGVMRGQYGYSGCWEPVAGWRLRAGNRERG